MGKDNSIFSVRFSIPITANIKFLFLCYLEDRLQYLHDLNILQQPVSSKLSYIVCKHGMPSARIHSTVRIATVAS